MLENPTICDVVIVGSGIAGLTVAWKLASSDLNVNIILITKKEKAESNTNYAQGGIAAVVSPLDSFQEHINDTLRAGDGLCNLEAVNQVINHGPERIQELIEIGIKFSRTEQGELDLGREGGHSKRRVIHASDLTGREIEKGLLTYCDQFENLKIYENVIAFELFKNSKNQVKGIYVYDIENDKSVSISAKKVVLATGGAGKVYMVTSNPNIATGDGIAIAARAGVSIGNLEFTQFHPTCVYLKSSRPTRFLISEALRGEGAILVDSNGTRFMPKYDDRAELASRDIVARAIDAELKITGAECVYLDISHKDSKFLKKRFPGIDERLLEMGIDFTKDKIPVIPAAHYFCGGVVVDLNGQSDIENLFAVGEVSCSGLHGANRLASNSLLEAVVYGHNTANRIIEQLKDNIKNKTEQIPNWNRIQQENLPKEDDRILISQNWDELRLTMTNYVGIVRSNKRLERAKKRLKIIEDEVSLYFNNYKINSDIIELRNLVEVAKLIIISALARKETRGTHTSIDFPEKLSEGKPSVIQKNSLGIYEHRSTHEFMGSIN